MTVDSQDPEDFFVVKSTRFLFSVNQVGEIAKRKKKKKKRINKNLLLFQTSA